MELRLELKKKYFFGILAGLLIVAGAIIGNAYGTFNPEIFGHTSSEVDVNGNWLIPYYEGAPIGNGSYKLGFEKEDGSFVYIGWEEDSTPQLQIVGSEMISGEGGGIEVNGDSWFVNSEVKAKEFCLESGECFESFDDLFGNLELSCTYAIRNAGEDVQIIDGNVDAVEAIGVGGGFDEKWGLGCVNNYKKTGCYLADPSGAEDSDVVSSGNGQGCLTDDEEFNIDAGLSIVCCKIGF